MIGETLDILHIHLKILHMLNQILKLIDIWLLKALVKSGRIWTESRGPVIHRHGLGRWLSVDFIKKLSDLLVMGVRW